MADETVGPRRLQAIGMLTLIQQTVADLDRQTRALAEIVGEPRDETGYYGHVSDIVWEKGNPVVLVESLLKADA